MIEKMSFDAIDLEIRKLVCKNLNLSVEPDQIDDKLLFSTASGFDSTSLLEFILALEDYFDILVPDDDLLPDNFGSISQITNYILKLKAA